MHATVVIDDLNDNSPQFLFTGVDCALEAAKGGGGEEVAEVECYHFSHHLGSGELMNVYLRAFLMGCEQRSLCISINVILYGFITYLTHSDFLTNAPIISVCIYCGLSYTEVLVYNYSRKPKIASPGKYR